MAGFLLGAECGREVPGRTRNDDARGSRGDDGAEDLQHERDTHEVDVQNRFEGSLARRESGGADDLRDRPESCSA